MYIIYKSVTELYIKMSKYQNGKIYTIRSPNTDLMYIGATIVSLSKRFSKHKYSHQKNEWKCSSSKILEKNDAYIELLEKYPCNSKEELNQREGELIRLYKDKCVNRCIAGRTPQQWLEDNKELRKEYKKSYQEKKKEEIRDKL